MSVETCVRAQSSRFHVQARGTTLEVLVGHFLLFACKCVRMCVPEGGALGVAHLTFKGSPITCFTMNSLMVAVWFEQAPLRRTAYVLKKLFDNEIGGVV